MFYRAPIVLLTFLLIPAVLVGCTMATPSQVRTGNIQLEQDVQTHTYDLAAMTEMQAKSLAREHERVGRGPISATVSYQVDAAGDLAKTKREMERVLAYLRRHGVPQTHVSYIANPDARSAGQAVFTYTALSARAPDHCTRMPGYQGAEGLDSMQSYQVSCESKDILSKMIANPTDLLGTDGRNSATSRRAGAVVETYQDGEPNENFYEIKSASEVSE